MAKFKTLLDYICFRKYVKPGKIPLYVLGVALMQSNAKSHQINDNLYRLVTVFFLMCMMVLTYGYQKSLMSMLTVNVIPDPVDDFETLNQVVLQNKL